MAAAREVSGLDCDGPFGSAAARVVAVRTEEVLEHADGVLGTENVEPLHDMRVASRRLRAALEAFEPCFPRGRRRKALKRVKRLADALGERRDRDVQIAVLQGIAGEVAEADRAALADLIARLREEQRQANEELAPLLEPDRLGKLERRLERLARGAGDR